MNRRHALKSLLAAATPAGLGLWTPAQAAANPVAAAPWPPRTAEGWTLPRVAPQLRFPRDHFLHADFQTEWWYLTGHLRAADSGREFGFQLTFFRQGLRPPGSPAARSRFLVDQQPLAHFAISDPQSGTLSAAQRLERAAFGRAGFTPPPEKGPQPSQSNPSTPVTPTPALVAASQPAAESVPVALSPATAHSNGPASPTAPASPDSSNSPASPTPDPRLVWVGDWSLSLNGSGFSAHATQPGQELTLQLNPARPAQPWVFHGEAGLSRKGLGNANNSIYYSATRLSAQGRLVLGAESFEVQGLAWMDREWSSQPLDDQTQGWDWFSLQLDDGRDLMLFQLRDAEGQRRPGGHGTLVEADGRSRLLTPAEFSLTPLQWWTSPRGGTRYPVGWKVEVPNDGLQLMVAARFEDQEINLDPLRYWEGMVAVRGQNSGRGYLEMTGYAQDSTLSRLRG